MFSVRGPAVIATVSELKAKTKETLGAASRGPVYVVRDGQPVAGIVSIEMMAVLEEALEDRRLAGIAAKRMNSIRFSPKLLGEDYDDVGHAAFELARTAINKKLKKDPEGYGRPLHSPLQGLYKAKASHVPYTTSRSPVTKSGCS